MDEKRKSKLSAIMFTDIVGYSRVMEDDENAALTLLDNHNNIIFPLIEQFEGKIIKTIGDALLVDFDSALTAANCAVNIQHALAEYNEKAEKNRRILIRIGIHVGDIWYTDNDIFGDSVNIAARLEPLALPGGICISKQVYALLANKINIKATKLGPEYLKNLSKTIDVYRLHTGVEEKVTDDREENDLLKNKVLEFIKDEMDIHTGKKSDQADLQKMENKDPGERIKLRIFGTIERFMDRAITEWDKLPQEKKDKLTSHIKQEDWFNNWEHKKRRNRQRDRNRDKGKGGEEFAVGLAATAGFGAAFFFLPHMWWLVFPLVFIGLMPMATGLVKLIRRRGENKSLPRQTTSGPSDTDIDMEKEVLKAAAELEGHVTVLQIATKTRLSIEQSRQTLDAMVKKGYVELNVDEGGILRYDFPELSKAGYKDEITKQIDDLSKEDK